MSRTKGATGEKEWRDQIRKAVHELRKGDTGKVKTLRLLARKLVKRALDGDIAALKEIGDRLDGKPAQAVEVAGAGGGALVVEVVRFSDDAAKE